jgi:NADPH-dependent 2,4-dienoyl-CoA reductase/sulfur reductase-like enzyme
VPDEALLARLLAVPPGSVSEVEVVRRSLDARKKPDLVYDYAVELTLAEPPGAAPEPPLALEPAAPRRAPELLLPPLERKARVAVVGTGPAGLFAALALADA